MALKLIRGMFALSCIFMGLIWTNFLLDYVAEKLTVMGPGEAFADTNLTALHEEIEAVAEGQ